MLVLHVWGPAFGLPSIDPHCLATIAYLQQAVPKGEWQLVAEGHPAFNPTNELPTLRHGDQLIAGFKNIAQHLARHSKGKWALDAGLSDRDRADCIAFSSFIESQGQPLLDLSLYVSSENYAQATRPTYNTFQSFPLPYLTPPAVRAAAKQRTAHMGLSSLDIDTDPDVTLSSTDATIPQSLQTPRATVSSLLAKRPETNVQIRLDALATEFLDSLQRLRGDRRNFASETHFSTLDCLALGYLSLMLLPKLPQPWLARTMRKRFPSLCAWVQEMRLEIYGGVVKVEDAFAPDAEHTLPWISPTDGGILSVAGIFLSSLADKVPVIGPLGRSARGGAPDGAAWSHLAMAGSALAGAGLFVGYMFMRSLADVDSGSQEQRGLDDFGEAGATPAAPANHIDPQRTLHAHDEFGAASVEVDVEVQDNDTQLGGI